MGSLIPEAVALNADEIRVLSLPLVLAGTLREPLFKRNVEF